MGKIKQTVKTTKIKYRKVDRYFGFANGTTGNIIRGKLYFDYQNLIKDMLNT